MGRTSSKRGAVLPIRQSPDLMVGVAGNSICRIPGYCEVEWVDGWNGGTSAARTSGWGSLINAGGKAGKMGRSLQGLSYYYNSPGRLAVFRRRFESAIRRPGMDPAMFATELGILAVRGFGDMGKRARDSMIRDRFIAAQRNCGLPRHLDGVSSDTPIRDIVDRCRMWESHSEQEPSRYMSLLVSRS